LASYLFSMNPFAFATVVLLLLSLGLVYAYFSV
jgi:hypothetical protein